jgi:competence protein ComEC
MGLEKQLRIYCFNEGRVDSILIGCDGRWMFIDGGYRKNGLSAIKKMKAIGVTKLDAYCISHCHKNHLAAGVPIIHQMKPDIVYANRDIARTTLLKYAKGESEKEAVRRAKISVLAPGDTFSLGNATFACIGPLKLKGCNAGAYAENSNSLILRMSYGKRTALFTGDTTGAILSAISKYYSLDVEVLKNAHHGARLDESVLKRITPQITAICNGSPPSPAYKKRLTKIGSKVFAACKKGKKGEGDFLIWTDGEKWEVETDLNWKGK